MATHRTAWSLSDKHKEEVYISQFPDHYHDEEKNAVSTGELPTFLDDDGEQHYTTPATTAKDLATEVIHAVDNPMLNPWTFRTWFLGKTSPRFL